MTRSVDLSCVCAVMRLVYEPDEDPEGGRCAASATQEDLLCDVCREWRDHPKGAHFSPRNEPHRNLGVAFEGLTFTLTP